MNSAAKLRHLARRQQRVRQRVFGTDERPRLNVFRSSGHIYAQIINDLKGTTPVSGVYSRPADAAGTIVVAHGAENDRLAEERTRGFLFNRGAPGGDGLAELSLKDRIDVSFVSDRGEITGNVTCAASSDLNVFIGRIGGTFTNNGTYASDPADNFFHDLVISEKGVRARPSSTMHARVRRKRPSAGWYGSVAAPTATLSRAHDARPSSASCRSYPKSSRCCSSPRCRSRSCATCGAAK